MRRGVPEAVIGGTTGIAAWFLAEMGRNVALEAEVAATGARLADPADAAAAELLATVKRAGFGDRELADLAATTPAEIRAARLALGLRPGYAMVDTCAAEFAAETPVLLLDLRRGRIRARGAAGRPSGGPRHRLRAGPDRAGDRVRLLRGPGGRHAPPRGLERGDDQLEPGDGLDRLRRLDAALLRAAGPGERPQRDRRRDARRRDAPAGRRRVRRPDAAQPGGAARRRAACRCSARPSSRSTRPRSGRGSRRSSTGSGSRSPRAAWPTASTRR